MAPFVSIGGPLRFLFVSISTEGRPCFVSRSFPVGFPSFPVSHHIHGKREAKPVEPAFRCLKHNSSDELIYGH